MTKWKTFELNKDQLGTITEKGYLIKMPYEKENWWLFVPYKLIRMSVTEDTFFITLKKDFVFNAVKIEKEEGKNRIIEKKKINATSLFLF